MKEEKKHTHGSVDGPVPGREYTCLMNGTALYDARVRDVMGCWATVEVVRPHPGPNEHHYKTGQTFDIRVSSYTFQEAL